MQTIDLCGPLRFRYHPEQESTANSDGGDESGGDGGSKSTSMSKTSLKLDTDNLALLGGGESATSMSENNKLLASLLKQINLLHETNTQIVRKLQETKGKSLWLRVS